MKSKLNHKLQEFTPVYERIKRLERDEYITKYVALLDKNKMNRGMTVFCNVRLKEHAKNVGSNFVKIL